MKPVICEHCDEIIGYASSPEEVRKLAEPHWKVCKRNKIPKCPNADLR